MARDFGWGRNQRTFAKAGAQTADAALANYDDREWDAIQVPHDWAVELPFVRPDSTPPADSEDAVAAHGYKAIGRNFPGNSVGWYRRPIDIAPSERGRAIWIEFDGVFRDSVVFVNGYVVGGSASGYAPFNVEIGDFLDYEGGPNVVALRVDASLGEGWFYEGAGIYRNVYLVSAAPTHVPVWGSFVRAEPDGDGARLRATTEVCNDGAAMSVNVRTVVFDAGVPIVQIGAESVLLGSAEQKTVDHSGSIPLAKLWSVEGPHLYTMVTELRVGDTLVDRIETPFGVRSIAFDAERGFLLNNRHVELLGTCNHQDHAGVGTAIPDALHAWRVAQLKAIGSNAWRSAHNPPAQALLAVCDRAGMLMVAEARLNSSSPQAMDDLDRLVRSSRNHPSIILWSVGNEEPHQGTMTGAGVSAKMAARIKGLDPTRPTTQAFDNHFGEGATRVVDVVGFNYRTDKIEGFHRAHPAQPTVGTETGSTVSTRGAYANDDANHVKRAYDSEHPWWASTAEQWWQIVADRPYIAGGFVWTGFDYRGEPTPFASFPSVSSLFGVFDLCGFAKDNAFYYKSQWCDEPMVHLLPHWTWPGREGQPIEVWAYSNCDEVDLILNGRSVGRKAMPPHGHLTWNILYQPGCIEARGFRGGRRVALDRTMTAGPAASIRLTADRAQIAADGRDLSIVRAEIIDDAGHIVPTASNPIEFELAGPARIIGVGNGNPTSLEPDHAQRRMAFNGLAQAIVQSNGILGQVRMAARSASLRAAALSIVSH
ncbi:MAG: beta-galactosidase GalA [Sphingomicrobium sp.]